MITIKELAIVAGTSKSTVSRVITNDPNVKPQTRERVERAIRDTGYKPNIVARSMIGGRLPLVLVTVGDIQNHYFAETFAGIEKTLTEDGYMAVLYNSAYDEEKEIGFIQLSRSCSFSGIIPMTGHKSELVMDSLRQTGLPVVIMHRNCDTKYFDRVYGDTYQASYSATRELLSMGYRRVIHFSGNSQGSTVSMERERGYRQAMADAAIPVEQGMVVRGDLSIDCGYALARAVLGGASGEPVAICSNNFQMSLGVTDFARRHSLEVWRDYGLAICETPPDFYKNADIIYAGPNLTEMGQTAAQLLLRRIRDPKADIQSVSFPSIVPYNPRR